PLHEPDAFLTSAIARGRTPVRAAVRSGPAPDRPAGASRAPPARARDRGAARAGRRQPVERAIDNVQAMVPALLFLCAGVPLAALLDELGLFDALAVEIERRWDPVP